MTAILFTTEQEAALFSKEYERGRFDGLREGETMDDGRFLVTVTGLGKIKATLRTERMLVRHKPEQVLHIGTCAAMSDELQTGDVMGVSQVFEGDRIELAAPTYPRMPLEVPFDRIQTGTLVTQDHTVSDKEEFTYWQRIADVTDMTGYAVAYVAAMHGIPCHIVKIVAGSARGEDKEFQKKLPAAHKKIYDFLMTHVVQPA